MDRRGCGVNMMGCEDCNDGFVYDLGTWCNDKVDYNEVVTVCESCVWGEVEEQMKGCVISAKICGVKRFWTGSKWKASNGFIYNDLNSAVDEVKNVIEQLTSSRIQVRVEDIEILEVDVKFTGVEYKYDNVRM